MAKETKCSQCGHDLKGGSLFCGNCGNKVEDQPLNAAPEKSISPDVADSESKLPWIVLAIGVVVTVAVIFMFTFSPQDGGRPQREDIKEPFAAAPDSQITTGQEAASANEKNSAVQAEKEEAQRQPDVPAGNRGEAENFLMEGVRQVQQGNLKTAAELFAKAVEADQSYALAWNNLGLALRKLGDTENAIKAYSSAINAQPDFALAYKNLGLILDEMGEMEGALGAYKKYCDLAPEAKDFDAIQARMQQLLNQTQ